MPVQASFSIGKFSLVKVGTVAAFGVTEMDVLQSLTLRVAQFGDYYGEVVVSRMGHEVPEPSSHDVVEVEQRKIYLRPAYRERLILDKFFCIIYLQSTMPGPDGVFAYVNVRGDRLEALLQRGAQDELFDLSEYATVVRSGIGTPSIEDREKLQRDYMFGERHINLRIFPPLDEVT